MEIQYYGNIFIFIFLSTLRVSMKLNESKVQIKPMYKFCNTLIPGWVGLNKKFAGRAGNFGPVDIYILNSNRKF